MSQVERKNFIVLTMCMFKKFFHTKLSELIIVEIKTYNFIPIINNTY